MNRRGFLAALVASASLDPEKLLWVPEGRPLISIPPASLARYQATIASTEYVLAFERYFAGMFMVDALTREACGTLRKFTSPDGLLWVPK